VLLLNKEDGAQLNQLVCIHPLHPLTKRRKNTAVILFPDTMFLKMMNVIFLLLLVLLGITKVQKASALPDIIKIGKLKHSMNGTLILL
jgi:hypothetical protein